MEQRPKKVGLTGALAIGIGGMVGGGIFAVLGEAVSLAHGGTCIASLQALLPCSLPTRMQSSQSLIRIGAEP